MWGEGSSFVAQKKPETVLFGKASRGLNRFAQQSYNSVPVAINRPRYGSPSLRVNRPEDVRPATKRRRLANKPLPIYLTIAPKKRPNSPRFDSIWFSGEGRNPNLIRRSKANRRRPRAATTPMHRRPPPNLRPNRQRMAVADCLECFAVGWIKRVRY